MSEPHENRFSGRNGASSRTRTLLDMSTANSGVARVFACPLFRKDPFKHTDCLRFRLMRVADVKQHILRRHIKDLTPKCPVCNVGFTSASDREEHLTLDLCSFAQPPSKAALHVFEQGIKKKLKDRSRRNMTYSDLCGILFGEEGKALKPYLEPVLQETSGMFCELLKSDWESLLPGVANNQTTPPITNHGDVSDKVMNQLRLRLEQQLGNSSSAPTSSISVPNIPHNSQERNVEISAFSFDTFDAYPALSIDQGTELLPQSWLGLAPELYNEHLLAPANGDTLAYADHPQADEDSSSFLERKSQSISEESARTSFHQYELDGDFGMNLEPSFEGIWKYSTDR